MATLDEIVAALRALHDANQDSNAAHLLYALRSLVRWITGTNLWPDR